MPIYISVIIPSLNRPAALERSLNSVLVQDTQGEFKYEIIAVLDKQDEESEAWLKRRSLMDSRINVYRSLRTGVNSARNLGIKKSQGEVIYFLDDDCSTPDKNLLRNLSGCFKGYPEASAIGGGYLLGKGEKDIFNISRNGLDNFYIEAYLSFNGMAGSLLGGNTAYKKEVFAKYGYFDEQIRYGSAETELNDRILKGGGKLYYIKELSVLHSPVNKNIIAYCLGSFRQGRGKAYSIAKNGRVDIPLQSKPGRLWFMRIATNLKVNLPHRILSALFLVAVSLCFHTGLLLSKMRRFDGDYKQAL